jgi:hypothetical protein
MRWLKERGLVSSYDDYVGLPLTVLEDARLLMTAEEAQAKKEADRNGLRR